MDISSHYLEPDSRAQLVSRLQHLVRFSDLLLMVIGADGSGRSTVLKQLQATDNREERREALLHFDATVDVTRLLTSLVEALELDCPADANNRTRLNALHQYSRALHEAGVPLVLLLDDADFLTNNALELLTNFALLEDAAPRVVLTGTEEFEQRFRANGLDQLVDGRLHVEPLGPFEPEEALAFLQELLPPGGRLSARQMQQLIETSNGLPGLMYRALQVLPDEDTPRRSGSAFPLPPAHLAIVGLILLAILGTSLWLYLPTTSEEEATASRVLLPLDLPVAASNEPVEQVIEVREELQQRLSEQEQQLVVADQPDQQVEVPSVADGRDEPPVSEAVSLPEEVPTPAVVAKAPAPEEDHAEAVVPRVETPEPAPAKEKSVAQSVEAAPVAPVTVAQEAVTQGPAASVSPATSGSPEVAEPRTAAVNPLSRADELLEWPDSGYTLQLLAARAEKSVEQFLKRQANPERFYYFATTYKNAPWHVVVYGQFADRTAAMNAVKTLPEELRKLRPWARSVASVKADIRR